MTLSLRALNRATLARQHLLARSSMCALDAIEHLAGMQAQAPFAPYYGLWSRLDDFAGDELSGLLTDRKAVRIVLMRGTIHLVSAADCHRLRPLVQPVLDRALTNVVHARPLAGVDVAAVVQAAGKLLDAETLTPAEIGARLAQQWPDVERTDQAWRGARAAVAPPCHVQNRTGASALRPARRATTGSRNASTGAPGGAL